MSTEMIERSDDFEDYPYVPNGPIDPGADDVQSGWTKEETWEMNAETTGSAGDYAVGTMFAAHYIKGPIDTGDGNGPLFCVITELYWVEPRAVECDFTPGTWRKAFDVLGSYDFTFCTNPEDPGSSEVYTDISYDRDLHTVFFDTYADAEALARKLALTDHRFALMWDGGIPKH